MLSYLVSNERGAESAKSIMKDLRCRLNDRPQITTDGLKSYTEAVEEAFGPNAHYAQIIKHYEPDHNSGNQERQYGPSVCTKIDKRSIQGNPDMEKANTSLVERHNLIMRMRMRRFTRLTNAFSKKIENHTAVVALFALHYNFCRIHKSLQVTPAMEAGLDMELRDCEWIVDLIDETAPDPGKPGKRYGKRKKSN
ncbi:MAG: IS1 family transposase [Gammaproteobacteria bacterium]|nr:IS1 family transposase [Gammaproteobacteria bacterium]